ncbi:hypothetical protein [Serratia proteamaculans]|uniref:Uncharacterized protein n=1 Tax=Serratia proteamaculans TaxID=28151 RepID=A0A5Q2VCY1_SERPR|nr:hypothetical protein [Serratia proteamaculans]QGH63452.1 hypothetical protein GHV41_22535 [Serratia proteamaculans]
MNIGNLITDVGSLNKNFYGDLHNMGHVFISYIHNPDAISLESLIDPLGKTVADLGDNLTNIIHDVLPVVEVNGIANPLSHDSGFIS